MRAKAEPMKHAFIKLTDYAGRAFYVDTCTIRIIEPKEGDGLRADVMVTDGLSRACRETPDEVIALIEASQK